MPPPARSASGASRIIATLVVLAVVLVIAIEQPVQLGPIRDAILRIGFSTVLAAFACTVLQDLLQVARFVSLRPSRWNIPRLVVARIMSFGQLVNTIAPARSGDALNLVRLHRTIDDDTVTAADVAGVIAADKIADFVSALILIALIGIKAVSLPAITWSRVGLVAAGVLAVIAALTALSRRLWPRAFDWLVLTKRTFLRGLATLTNPSRAGISLTAAAGSWLAEIAALIILCSGLGIHLSLGAALWVFLILNIGISIPTSIANLGAYEALVVFGLREFHVPLNDSIAVAIVHHALQLLGVSVCAALFALAGRHVRPSSPPHGPTRQVAPSSAIEVQSK